MTAVAKIEAEPQIHNYAASIFDVIARAAGDPTFDVEKLERLMAMEERVAGRNAQAAFASAFAQMQQDLPTIAERGVGDKKMKYALWEDVNEAIRPVLAKHGFGLSFKTGRSTDRVTVTAILMHRVGHSEETTLELPVDTSGSKNAVQAVGSSTSYGKRYTAQALLNLVSRDGIEHDDDGRGARESAAPAHITEEQADKIEDLIGEVGADREKLFRYLKITSLLDIYANRFDDVVRLIETKRGKA